MDDTDDTFSLNDLPNTTISAEGPILNWCRSETLYWIFAWAQTRSVDFLPVIPQVALQSLGVGLTATVQQSYVNPKTELAYKPCDPRNLLRFFKELQILSHPKIRFHPFISTLEGLCCEVNEADSSISPIFVFEKALLGDLGTFMKSYRGTSMQPTERLALCCQIAIAMADLEEIFVIHGDLKPKNILVYEAAAHNGAVILKITDFGHATEGTHGLVYLPESRPWSIPPPEYHSRGFSFEAAAKAMVYSLGACCLWLLFYNHPDNPDDNFPSAQRDAPHEPLLDLAQHHLHSETWPRDETRTALANLFQSSLTLDTEARTGRTSTILDHVKRAFELEQPFVNTDKTVISTRYPTFEDDDEYVSFLKSPMFFPTFNVCRAMHVLCEVDPKIRQAIFQFLCERESAHRAFGDFHWKRHCLDLALCHYIGFGTRRNETISTEWLEKTEFQSDFASALEVIRDRGCYGYLKWTSWSRRHVSDVQTTAYTASYYLGRRPLQRVLQVLRDELNDWKAALGPRHWVVNNRLSSLVHLELVTEPKAALQTAMEGFNLASSPNQSQSRGLEDSMFLLATAYSECNMADEAEQTAKRLLQNLDEQLPPTTTSDLQNPPENMIMASMRARTKALLAGAFESNSKLEQAESLRREIVRDLNNLVGETHPLALEQLARLALLLDSRRKKKESRALFEKIEKLATSSWSPNHDLALLARQNLTQAPHPFWWSYRRSHPKLFQKETIENYQITLGNFGYNTLTAMQSGVWLLCQEFRWAEALELMEHTLRHAAIVYRDEPDTLRGYQRNASTVRWMCLSYGNKVAIWIIKHRFRWVIGFSPSMIPRSVDMVKFRDRYEHTWGPFYKVKSLWVAREPYHFDPFKDPDFTEQDNEAVNNTGAVEAQNYLWFRWFNVNQLYAAS